MNNRRKILILLLMTVVLSKPVLTYADTNDAEVKIEEEKQENLNVETILPEGIMDPNMMLPENQGIQVDNIDNITLEQLQEMANKNGQSNSVLDSLQEDGKTGVVDTSVLDRREKGSKYFMVFEIIIILYSIYLYIRPKKKRRI